MSKIQDALRRLQSEDRPRDGERKGQVAQISPRTSQDLDDTASLRYERPDIVIEIDQRALREEGLFAPNYHARELADEYRQIKRPLIANAFGKRVVRVEGGNVIMITSAFSGEGKTFSSINLALSMAQERDHSVLLVDADVAKPHISKIFGVADEQGLLDIIENTSVVPDSLVIDTDVNGLSLLPAGSPRENATELLASDRMEEVIQQIATRFNNRLVIFDTPPLLDTSEAKVLMDFAGQIVLVVRAEHTPQGAVHEALHLIREEKVVNLVLNQSRMDPGKGSYGYGYSAQSRRAYPAAEGGDQTGSLWGK